MSEQNEEVKKSIAGLEEKNQDLERELEPLYTVIGKNYYEKPEGYEKEIEKAAGRLDTVKKQIHENRIAILAWKGIRLCPNCGSEVEQGAIFCGECGIRMEKIKEVDENSTLCSRCGAKNEKGKKFCVICGQKLVDIIKAIEEDSAQILKEQEGESAEAEAAKAEPETELLEETGYLEEVAAAAEEDSNEVASNQEQECAASAADTVSEPAPVSDLADSAEMPREDMIFCPECGKKIPADALFCEECGTRIVEEMSEVEVSAPADDIPLFCPECGNKLPANALFCTECGAKVGTYQEASVPADDIPLFCPECGAKLNPGSVFCTECGTPVAAGR